MRTSDSFTEAANTAIASHTPDVNLDGGAWANVAGTAQVNGAGDYAEGTGVAPGGGRIATHTEASANGRLRGRLRTIITGAIPRLYFRCNSSSSYWYVGFNTTGGGNLVLVRNNGGGDATIATAPISGGFQPNTNYDVTVTLNGSSITVEMTGITTINVTDSYNSSIAKHGFGTTGTAGNARFDNYEWDDSASGSSAGLSWFWQLFGMPAHV